jgi:hypothetical protein
LRDEPTRALTASRTNAANLDAEVVVTGHRRVRREA